MTNDHAKREPLWYFETVPESDRARIIESSEHESASYWRAFISPDNRHPMLLKDDDWTSDPTIWGPLVNWVETWGEEQPDFEREIATMAGWSPEDRVFMLYSNAFVVTTTWALFTKIGPAFCATMRDHSSTNQSGDASSSAGRMASVGSRRARAHRPDQHHADQPS